MLAKKQRAQSSKLKLVHAVRTLLEELFRERPHQHLQRDLQYVIDLGAF
jgi:hypothetical protein